ncbi:rhomboid-like protein [Leishmania tarentolae]|uniref:Rhomboid-like protein n=1 Tax=Leishmania tarentolae TaxID=5689 RepID=A0A640KCJ7_LEITA|nr:rhomboid-like protein [Leishmania tarentolae]
MVRAQSIYAAIDFAPILVLLTVHCSSGRWPTDAECAERVTRYGFSVDTFSERPASVLTHLFVHISSRHLLSNVFSFAATLAEFGDVAATVAEGAVARRWWARARDDEAPRVSGRTAGSSASRRLGSRMRAVFGQGSCLQACVHSAGAFFVWAVGGAVGGLSSQMLYNNLMVALRRRCAARAAAAAADATRKAGAVAADGRILESLSRVAESIRQRVEACNSNLAVSAQEAVSNAMLMCGASAGICALSGFSTAYYGRCVTAWCLVVPEALLLATDLVNRYVALLAPKIGALDCAAEAERRALRSTWRILMPAQTIGHAAHVGGFVMGLGMGYGWLWVRTCRRRATQRLPRPGMQAYVHVRSHF